MLTSRKCNSHSPDRWVKVATKSLRKKSWSVFVFNCFFWFLRLRKGMIIHILLNVWTFSKQCNAKEFRYVYDAWISKIGIIQTCLHLNCYTQVSDIVFSSILQVPVIFDSITSTKTRSIVQLKIVYNKLQ